MATSGSFSTGTSGYGGGYPNKLTFTWSLASQSTQNNTSTINWRVYADGGSNGYWQALYHPSCNVDGEGHSGGTVNASQGQTIFSGTKVISHNSDGTKTFSASASGGFYSSGNNASGSGSWVLPTIARASQPSCITYPNTTQNVGAIGSTFTIHMNRKSSAFTHTVRYAFGSLSGTIATNVTNNCQWTIPTTFYAEIPNSQTGTGTIYVDTYNGNTSIGTKSVSFTCSVTNSNPTVGTFTYEDANSATTAITGDSSFIIQGNSILRFTTGTATARNSATIASYKINFNGTDYTKATAGDTNINYPNVTSNMTATLTVTDSRGFTDTATVTVKVLAWSLPYAVTNLARQQNYYTATDLLVNGSYSSLDGNNELTITCQYKKTTDSSYSSEVAVTNNTTKVLQLDNQYQWDVKVILQDKLGSTVYNLTLDRGQPLVFFDRLRNSTGFNCFPTDKDSVEVDGNISATGTISGFLSTTVKILPSGTDGLEYWRDKVPCGWYWYGNSGSPSNMPAGWGFVFVVKYNSDWNVLFFTQSQGHIYRRSGNYNLDNGWTQLV